AQEHKQWMPAAAGTSQMAVDPRTSKPVTVASLYPGITDTDPRWQTIGFADWIIWTRSGPDRYAANQINSTCSLNVTYSGRAPSRGIKRRQHKTEAGAWDMGPNVKNIGRCPSDRPEAHFPRGMDSPHGSSPYSYTINRLYAMPGSGQRYDDF